MQDRPLKSKDTDIVNILKSNGVNFKKREQIHFQNTLNPQRTPKINVTDLTQEGNNYEVSFFNKTRREKTSKKTEHITEINEDECENFMISPRDVQIKSEETIAIEYNEPPPKKTQYWFIRFFTNFFNCCAV